MYICSSKNNGSQWSWLDESGKELRNDPEDQSGNVRDALKWKFLAETKIKTKKALQYFLLYFITFWDFLKWTQ